METGKMKLILIFSLICQALAAPPLESYNVESGSVTVSGISAGGAFASQMHVAYSSTVKGVATFAGVPYWCAKGLAYNAVSVCMPFPGLVDVSSLISKVYDYQSDNDVDSAFNLVNSKVFLFQGTNDDTVRPGNADNFIEFYDHFGADIKTMTTMNAGHAQPTLEYGADCPSTSSPYINRCNYDGAFEALDHLYEGLTQPSGGAPSGQFLEFDQLEFDTSLFGASLDPDGGYIYVPSTCASGASCKLHVAFHGCRQGREFLTPSDEFARRTGYLEVADANNIIILFPQNKSSILGLNPNGCFDWWGYDGLDYARKNGVQMRAVKAMIDRVMGNN